MLGRFSGHYSQLGGDLPFLLRAKYVLFGTVALSFVALCFSPVFAIFVRTFSAEFRDGGIYGSRPSPEKV